MNHTFCIYSMRFPVKDAKLQCFDPAVLSCRQALSRHKREMHVKFISKFQCPFCNFMGTRQDDVLRGHIRKTRPQRYRDVALRDILEVVEERGCGPGTGRSGRRRDSGRGQRPQRALSFLRRQEDRLSSHTHQNS